MNNEKNKKYWLNKCENTLMIGGRSKATIRNYIYAISHFLNYYKELCRILHNLFYVEKF